MYTNDTDITKHLSTANTDISQILKELRLSNPNLKLVNYREYKKFSFENFKTSLGNALRYCSTDY